MAQVILTLTMGLEQTIPLIFKDTDGNRFNFSGTTFYFEIDLISSDGSVDEVITSHNIIASEEEQGKIYITFEEALIKKLNVGIYNIRINSDMNSENGEMLTITNELISVVDV